MFLDDGSNLGKWKDEKEGNQLGEEGKYCRGGEEEAGAETDAPHGQICMRCVKRTSGRKVKI